MRSLLRRGRRAALVGALRSLGGLALTAALGQSCRAPVPDEHVYTGRDTTARGSSSGLGGSSSLGRGGAGEAPNASGGRGGASPSTSRGGTASNPDEQGAADAGGENPARGGAGPSTEPPPFSKTALLGAIASCTLQQIEEFAARAGELAQATAANEAEPSEATSSAARAAWLTAMDSFQVLEALRFGPLARASEDPKGQDVRDQLYAWPLGGRCNVETQLVSRAYLAPSFGSALINLRGLGTLEYLLFYPGGDNACPSYSPLNKDGTWAALDAEELARRKAGYAAAVARDVALHAQRLLEAWTSGGGDFRASFAAGKAYPSVQAALNAVSNALFYVEVEVKDLKLGVPLGLSPDCTSATCPEALESRYAGTSKRNILRNLNGFRRLFAGCSQTSEGALGFDDWLSAVGAGELSERMLNELDAAERSVSDAEPPLEQQLTSDPAAVRRIYDEVKALTDLLKSEFVSVLELELPKSTEGDND